MRIVAEKDIGAVGPRLGPPTVIQYPFSQALRIAVLWLVFGAVLLRKANRTGGIWLVLLPIIAIHLTLMLVERGLNNHVFFHPVHLDACSSICDFMRILTVAWGIVFAISDRIQHNRHWMRALLALLLMLILGILAISQGSWPIPIPVMCVLSGVIAISFMVGQGLINIVIYGLVKSQSPRFWQFLFCLLIGLGPLSVLGGIEFYLNQSCLPGMQKHFGMIRILLIVFSALFTPHFILCCFALPGIWQKTYQQRLSRCLLRI